MVDFDQKLGKEKAARLEEALLHMGILDALIIAPQYREQVLQSEEGCCDRYLFTDAEYVRTTLWIGWISTIRIMICSYIRMYRVFCQQSHQEDPIRQRPGLMRTEIIRSEFSKAR